MTKPDLSGYVESLEATMTLVGLIVGFIFTALTVILQLTDPTSILTQAALLALFVAFSECMLGLGIMQQRIWGILEQKSTGTPSTPGWSGPGLFNFLILSAILIMNVSIILMMFAKGLIYIGLASVILTALTSASYLLFISPYKLKSSSES